MLLTEEEAKEKACCTTEYDKNSNCIASKCMAWRWDIGCLKFNIKQALKETGVEIPQSEWKGYCGLAGRIE